MLNECSQEIGLGKKERVGDESYRKIYRESKTVSIVINFFSEESVDKFFNDKILIK